MPVTVDQLRKEQKEHPVRFRNEQKAVMAFSKVLFRAAQTLQNGNEKDRKIAKELRSYSDALEKVSRDPSEKTFRDQIDNALDKLSTMGDYLGSAAGEGYGATNICDYICSEAGVDDYTEVQKGLRAVNSYCGFSMNVTALRDGVILNPSEKELQSRREANEAWKQQREREKEAEQERDRKAAKEAERKRQEKLVKQQEQKKLEEEEERRRIAAEKKAEEEKKRLEELKKQQEAEERKSAEQKERERLEAEAKEKEHQKDLQKNLRSDIQTLLEQARDPNMSLTLKLANFGSCFSCRWPYASMTGLRYSFKTGLIACPPPSLPCYSSPA